MLERSVEIKGRETAGISGNGESLQLLHILSNVTSVLWTPGTTGGLYARCSSSAAAVPGQRSPAPPSCWEQCTCCTINWINLTKPTPDK